MQLLAKTVLTLSLIAPFAASAAWDLNDVSILFPLPKQETELSLALRGELPSDQGDAFIPKTLHDHLVESLDPADQALVAGFYAKWMVVSARIDHCFHEHIHDPCEKQIRLVWQPISAHGGVMTTENAALHTSYRLTDEEWPKAIAAFATIRAASERISGRTTTGLPLAVHPGFAKGGVSGEFMRVVQRQLSPWVAQSRLTILAVALPSDGAKKLLFKRFAVWPLPAKRRLLPLWISYSPELEIRYGNSVMPSRSSTLAFREMGPSVLKPNRHGDDLRELLRDSEALKGDRKALTRLSQIEQRVVNPTVHGSVSVDCLSCHATGATAKWFSENFPDADRVDPNPFRPEGKYDLRNTTAQTRTLVRFRAFGYEGTDPQILDRAIFESAKVADALNGLE